jgi:hypothetical protein
MAAWVGITIALSLVIIAMCLVGVAVTALMSLKEIRQISQAITIELEGLRRELAESLGMMKRLGEQGQDVLDLAKDEIHQIVRLTSGIRDDIAQGRRRVKRRLADFDAVVEVVQDEVEETAIELGATLRSARDGGSMIGQLSRLVRPRSRSRV